MCGIVGLFAKSAEIEAQLGRNLAAMLIQLGDRGPDSSGVAVYRDPAPSGWCKLTLYSAARHVVKSLIQVPHARQGEIDDLDSDGLLRAGDH